jgi:hypothetical protein
MSLHSVDVASAGLTTATTAYIAGDQLGDILELASIVEASGGRGRITSIRLVDQAKITGSIELFVFRASVTLAADNAAFNVSDSDMVASFVGSIILPQGSDGADNRAATLSYVGLDFDCAATSLFVALKTLQGHTFFGAATDLNLRVSVERP